MQRTRPLKDHPEFSIIEHQGWYACLVLGAAYLWQWAAANWFRAAALALGLLLYVSSRLTQVIWESVVVFPSLGLQLETHRGFAGVPLLVSRTFVAWSSLEDFLINEGIRGWDIRYYLVAITRTSQEAIKLEVAFENILPRFPVLSEVYNGVQDALSAEDHRRSGTLH